MRIRALESLKKQDVVDAYKAWMRPSDSPMFRKVSFHAISKHAQVLDAQQEDPMYRVRPDNVYLDSLEAKTEWHSALSFAP